MVTFWQKASHPVMLYKNCKWAETLPASYGCELYEAYSYQDEYFG